MAEVATQPATVVPRTVVAQPAAGGLTRRMPTSTLGMAGDWSCPPTADRKLDASKKDFTLCGALCGSPGRSATVAADAAGSETSVGAATSGAAWF